MRTSLLILPDTLAGSSTRFSQCQKSLGIATNILAGRLDGFVAAGLSRQHPMDDHQGPHRLEAEH